MGLCPDFYMLEAWRKAGYNSLEDFRRRFWEAYFLPMDPNNLLCMGLEVAPWGRQQAHERGPRRGARTDPGEDVRHPL
jgi:hypothetical protein